MRRRQFLSRLAAGGALADAAAAAPGLIGRLAGVDAAPVRRATNDYIVAVGDSVMLGAAGALHQLLPGISVDAAVSRQIYAVTNILFSLGRSGLLSDIVVIHTGNNGPISFDDLDTMMQTVSGCARVILLNNKEPRSWEQGNDALFAQAVPYYANAELIDWRAASIYHPEYFGEDGIHLTPTGAWAYASLVAGQIGY